MQIAILAGLSILGSALNLSQKDLNKWLPIFAEPTQFNAKPGEHIRLGAFYAYDKAKQALEMGLQFMVSKTDELGPPDSTVPGFTLSAIQRQKEETEAAGLKWSLMAFTTFPDLNDSEKVGEGMIDLISGASVLAWSPWNSERIRWSADQFGWLHRNIGKPFAVTLGVHGEDGNASLWTGLARNDPHQLALWQSRRLSEPPPAGIWAADTKAKNAWKNKLEQQFGSVQAAFSSWGVQLDESNPLPTPIEPRYPYVTRYAYMDWYHSAVPNLVRSLTDIASEIFRSSHLLIPVGPPSAEATLASDLFRIAKATAERADALEVTNIGYYDFATNWAMSLARIRGAVRAVQLPLWSKSAWVQDPPGFERRLFESLSLGTVGHADTFESWEQNQSAFELLLPDLIHYVPRCDVAILSPSSQQFLRPKDPIPPLYYRGAVELRDYADFDVLEESAVMAGALNAYRLALLYEGTVWNAATLQALKSWVEAGGVVAAYDFGKMADLMGDTSVYQTLFGFASELAPAKPGTRWVGEVPAHYKVPIGGALDPEILTGNWGRQVDNGRIALSQSGLRLPLAQAEQAIVTLTLGEPPVLDQRVEVIAAGRRVASIPTSVPTTQLRFPLEPRGNDPWIEFAFSGVGAMDRLVVASVEVALVESTPVPLSGFAEGSASSEQIRAWSRPVGRGMAVFFPGKKEQWKEYTALVRTLIYHLSEIDPSRQNARKLDDKRDRVFITDFGQQVVAYNANPKPASVTLKLEDKLFPLDIPPGAMRIASTNPIGYEAVFQCEDFPAGLQAEYAPYASPGHGTATAVRVSPGQDYSLVFEIPEAGPYRIYARTLWNERLTPVSFEIAGQVVRPTIASDSTHDLYGVGEFELNKGMYTLRMSSDRPFLADMIVVSSRPRVVGYRFARLPKAEGRKVRS